MSIFRLLDHVEAGRVANAETDSVGINPDELIGLFWELQDRSQLDRLVAGLADGPAVAERAERALRLKSPVAASDDDIETWGYACLEEWVGLARRRRADGPVLEAFEALANMAVEVVDQDDQSNEAFRLNGSLMGAPALDADSELTSEQLALIHGETFELLATEISLPAGWDEVAVLLAGALQDEPMFGAWLLAPAASWDFNFEPFYKLWRAGVSLWVSPDMIEAVQGSAIWGDSFFGTAPAKPVMLSDADEAWLQSSGAGSKEALRLIASSQSTGGTRLDFTDFGLLSLPPALVVEGGWTLLQLGTNPGLDPARLSELDRLELLVLRSCALESFDIALPPGLQRISLYGNDLTAWPSGVAAASTELVRLDLQYNQLTEVPDEVAALSALEDLDVASNKLTAVSPSIGQLSKLTNLNLHSNRELARLPEEILQLPAECSVSLFGTALPESFHKAKTISELTDVWNDLSAVS